MNVHPFYNYFTPQIRDVSVIRCDSNGTESVTGSCIRISASRLSCFDYLGNNDGWISCIIRYRYRLYESAIYSDWVTIPEEPQDPHSQNYDPSRGSVDTGVLNLGLSADKDYEVMVGVLDSKGNSNNTSVILYSGNVFMHKDGEMNSISIGETVTEKDTVSIASKITAWVKGLLKIGGQIDFYDSNGVKGGYAKAGAIELFSGDSFATITPNYIGFGNGAKNYVSMNYDSQNKRGYISIDGEPLYGSHAVNKAYVDGNFAPSNSSTSQTLDHVGWYRVGVIYAFSSFRLSVNSVVDTVFDNGAIVDIVAPFHNPVLSKISAQSIPGSYVVDQVRLVKWASVNWKYYVDIHYVCSSSNPVYIHILGAHDRYEQYKSFTEIYDYNIDGNVAATISISE